MRKEANIPQCSTLLYKGSFTLDVMRCVAVPCKRRAAPHVDAFTPDELQWMRYRFAAPRPV